MSYTLIDDPNFKGLKISLSVEDKHVLSNNVITTFLKQTKIKYCIHSTGNT